MAFLKDFLPIIIYLALIVFIIVAIIIGIKLIIALNKINRIADNVEQKVNTLNGAFALIDNVTSKVNGVYTKLADIIIGAFEKVFSKKERDDEFGEFGSVGIKMEQGGLVRTA